MSDIFDDLLDGVPPWQSYDDNVKMSDVMASAPDAMAADFALPPSQDIEFPPHWAELMEQIRVREEQMKREILSRRSGERVEEPRHPDGMLPPSSYSLLPPQSPADSNIFEPPHVPYPHLPFWTAAPLPFSPSVYPVNVLPPSARESLLAPKAPPLPEVKKKKRPGRKPKGPGRPRDSRGLFTKTSSSSSSSSSNVKPPQPLPHPMPSQQQPAVPLAPPPPQEQQLMLVGKIQELQQQLQQSRYESSVLREQLVASQHELLQLKDRGLVKSTIKGYQSEPSAPTSTRTPVESSATGRTFASSPPLPASSSEDLLNAFRVQLDYNQLKSKLRPTHNGHYDVPLNSPDEQQGFHFVMEPEVSEALSK